MRNKSLVTISIQPVNHPNSFKTQRFTRHSTVLRMFGVRLIVYQNIKHCSVFLLMIINFRLWEKKCYVVFIAVVRGRYFYEQWFFKMQKFFGDYIYRHEVFSNANYLWIWWNTLNRYPLKQTRTRKLILEQLE